MSQHFLLSSKARSLSIMNIVKMSDMEAWFELNNKNSNIEQIKLNDFYKDTLKIDTLLKLEDKDNLSAPLLLKVFDSYLNSKIKIMFVGKETNHWLSHKSRPIEKRGINYLINDYEVFDELIRRYEKCLQDTNSKTSNRFFSKYNLFNKTFNNNELGAIIWNNLYKCSYDKNRGYSKNSKGHSELLDELSKKLFKGTSKNRVKLQIIL